MSKFSAEEDEKLIDFVEANGCLFRVSEQDYKNSQKKAAAWAAIGAQLDKSGEYFN